MDVTSRIDGLLSQVTVRQTFLNATDEPLEATYIFPLPDRAAVTDFRMEVAGRVVEGVLKERGQARREYTQAIDQGHRASIAEEERPGVFTLRVGNLMPGDVAKIELGLVGILPYSDGEVTFRFPLVVAPRYIPGVPLTGPSVGDGTAVDTSAVPDASRISPPVLLPGFPNPVRLSLAIDLYASTVPADNLRVSLFTVWGEEKPGVRRLTLQPGERLDRDFILRFRLGGESVRTSLSLHPDPDETSSGTFALTVVPPPAVESGSLPRDVIFVLDRSGSMAGWKIVAARRAMGRVIDTLTESDRFNVFAFDNDIDMPQWAGQDEISQLIWAADRHRFTAVEFLAKLEARGGTEIAEPLKRAVGLLADHCADRDHNRERIIFLVTDGQVGNEDQVLSMLGSRLKGIRVFTLGIDQAVNAGFLNRLAELGASGGSCELVESEERLDAVMDSIHCRISTPVVMDVHLDAARGAFEIVAGTLVPDRPPCLFAGSPLLLLGRYRGRPHGPVAVRGKIPNDSVWTESVVPDVRENGAVTSAWARGQVRQLEDRYAAGTGDRSVLEQAIIATSLKHRILCRFTAYVAVDRSTVANEGGAVHQFTQPVEMPAGWGEEFTECGVAYFALPPHFEKLGAVCAERLAEPSEVASMSCEDSRITPLRGGSLLARRKNVPASAPRPPAPPSFLPASPEDLLRKDGFTLLEAIARDERGTLHKGRDKRGRLVTIRLLKKSVTISSSGGLADGQKRLTGLKHPALVPILKLIGDARSGQVVAVVSDYVAGQTLTDWLSRVRLPDPGLAARLILILAEAVDHANRRGVFFRNLLAHTIWIADDGRPRIDDYGLTYLDTQTASSGTNDRAFVAPELMQDRTRGTTPGADVFSLGVIFFRMLTGVWPDEHVGSDRGQAPGAINSRLPAELEAICMRALAIDPAKRYGSAAKLAADLRAALSVKPEGLLGRIMGKSKSRPDVPAGEKESFWK
jgi:Ca-activated chloride channel family protein